MPVGMLDPWAMAERWAPVQAAMASGEFDPQGANAQPPMSFNERWSPAAQMPGMMNPAAIPMPQPRPMMAPQMPQPDQAALPANATPTVGALAPLLSQAAGSASLPSGSLLERIGKSLSDNSNMLMMMGAGFAGAPSFGHGLSRALAGGAQGSQIDRQSAEQTRRTALQESGIAQTYRALIGRGVSPQEALAAVYNPDVMKAVVGKYFEVKQPTYGVIGEDQFGNKQYGWIDPYKQTTTPGQGGAGTASSEPVTITGPDGKPIAVPPGQDPKKFRDHITAATADAAAGKLTEVQAKDYKFANKMELAEHNMKAIETEGLSLRGKAQEGSDKIPGSQTIGNLMQTPNYQKYVQARNNFITALLRDESGAAIGTSEFARYERELFPQPGDSKEVIAQKREARKVAIEAMKKGAGPAYKSPAMSGAPGNYQYDPASGEMRPQ